MLVLMTEPLVSCTSCERRWYSATLAEGLRSVGHCPRCGGELRFAGQAGPTQSEDPAATSGVAPHLVLGVPRR